VISPPIPPSSLRRSWAPTGPLGPQTAAKSTKRCQNCGHQTELGDHGISLRTSWLQDHLNFLIMIKCTCGCTYIYICVCDRLSVYTYIYTYTFIYIYTHISFLMCIYIHTHNTYVYVHMYICIIMHIYIIYNIIWYHTYMSVHVYTVCIYICVCVVENHDCSPFWISNTKFCVGSFADLHW
jgi:hypothetical protein